MDTQNSHGQVPSGGVWNNIYDAVKNQDKAAVKEFIENGANLAAADKDGNGPLYYAIETGNLDLVNIIIQSCVSAAEPQSTNQPSLDLTTIPISDRSKLKNVVNAASATGYHLLYYAVNKGNLGICISLLKAGANIKAIGHDGNSILYHAIEVNSIEIVKALIFPRQGESNTNIADVNHTGYKVTILHQAIIRGNIEIIEQLILAEVDVNLPSSEHSPLYHSVMHGNKEIVQLLLSQGANVIPHDITTIRAINTDGNNSESITALLNSLLKETSIYLQSVETQNIYFLEMLIEFKKNQKHENNIRAADKEHNLLYKAATMGNVGIVKLLVDNDADPNGVENDTTMMPVLYLAAIVKENVAITSVLTLGGANIYGKYQDVPILHHAIEKCNLAIVQAMLPEPERKPNAESTERNIAATISNGEINTPTSSNNRVGDEDAIDNNEAANTPNDGINTQTTSYCNALEFALVHSTPEITVILIKNGARITSKSLWQPVNSLTYDDFIFKVSYANIKSTLDNMLDETTMSIDYRILSNTDQERPDQTEVVTPDNADETLHTLWQISEQEQFQDLLPHPVFTAFNQWMWEFNLAKYYYINVIFCILLYINLFWYHAVHYRFIESISDLTAFGILCYSTLLVLSLVFLLREGTQLIKNYRSYLQNVENYFELLLLFYIGYTLAEIHWFPKVQTIGMCNVLMALSITMLIGHTDYAATPVNILRTVSLTFFKYFIPYALIFLAFALTFYQLFSSSKSELDQNTNNTTNVTTPFSVTDFFSAILRVLAKFTGELQVSDINDEKYTFLPFVISACFIFLCPIIMLNLLNGLAVCDIINEEHLKIFMQKTRLNYLYNAQQYYKITQFKKVFNSFGLRLNSTGFDKIYLHFRNAPDTTRSLQTITNQPNSGNGDFIPLLDRNKSQNHSPTKGESRPWNSIYNNKIMKDASNIINNQKKLRTENVPHILLSEVNTLKKTLSQVVKRIDELHIELEESRAKSDKSTEQIYQKLSEISTTMASRKT